MGMTIDKAIEHGKEQLEIFGGEHKEFIECAVETMRKYQKIVDIVTDDYGYPSNLRKIMDIKEVLEDGNDN
jgi:GH18 family chitinase